MSEEVTIARLFLETGRICFSIYDNEMLQKKMFLKTMISYSEDHIIFLITIGLILVDFPQKGMRNCEVSPR